MGYQKYYKNKSTITKPITKPVEEEKKINFKESEAIDKSIFILQLVALLIIPLFIKARMDEFISPDFTMIGTEYKVDVFSHYKYILLVIITIIMSLLFFYKIAFLGFEIKKDKMALLTCIIAILFVISAVASPYKSIALHGTYDRYEGAITYICYLMQFYVASNIHYTNKRLTWLIYSITPFVIINFILGLSLFMGKDIFDIKWVNNFIMSSVSETGELQQGTLWSTLSNPNYISGIGAVLTILFLTWAIFDNHKVRSSINVIISIFSFIMVLSSFSTSGFLTMMVLLPIILISIFFTDQKLKSFVVLLAFVILATSVYIPMANKNPRVWDETFGFIIKENPFVKEQASLLEVKKFVFEKGLSEVFLPAKAYAEVNGEESIKFEVPTLPEPGISAGSGRSYIWDKTIETAMKRPILGYGLDTFTFVFPQDNIDKVAGLQTYDIIVDKPHNMYLGLFIGSGIIALLTFILLVGAIILKGVKGIWRRRLPQSENALILSIFTAIIAYLVQGMFNDSVIGSAVIFWILLGVLVSILNKDKVVGG